MIDPARAAEELERCVSEHGFVGMVTATHIREHDLDGIGTPNPRTGDLPSGFLPRCERGG